jgi:hypothetical protein
MSINKLELEKLKAVWYNVAYVAMFKKYLGGMI